MCPLLGAQSLAGIRPRVSFRGCTGMKSPKWVTVCASKLLSSSYPLGFWADVFTSSRGLTDVTAHALMLRRAVSGHRTGRSYAS